MPIGTKGFTVADGMKYQKICMIKWQKILKPDIFEQLQQECIRQNTSLPSDATGYDVWRGDDITRHVLTIQPRLTPVG